MDMLTIAVWAIFFGIVFAVIYTRFQANLMTQFISSLELNKAYDEPSAKNLEDLGFKKSLSCRFLRSRLETNFGLSKMIISVPDVEIEDLQQNQITLFKQKTTYKYYILQDKVNLAHEKFKKDNVPFWKSALLILVLFVVACLAVGVIRFLSAYSKNVFTKPDNSPQSTMDSQNTQSQEPDNFETQETLPESNSTPPASGDEFLQPVIPTPENNY